MEEEELKEIIKKHDQRIKANRYLLEELEKSTDKLSQSVNLLSNSLKKFFEKIGFNPEDQDSDQEEKEDKKEKIRIKGYR